MEPIVLALAGGDQAFEVKRHGPDNLCGPEPVARQKKRGGVDGQDAACGPLHLRTATTAEEIELLRDALNQGHYLKAGRPAGHVLWQGAYERDPESGTETLVAALSWGGAALRLTSSCAASWLSRKPGGPISPRAAAPISIPTPKSPSASGFTP